MTENDVKVKEYLTLRDEVVDALKIQNNWSTFTISAVITLLGIAIGLENKVLELFLLPYVVIFTVSLKVNNFKRNVTVKVGYMITRLESADGFLWESCLNRYRALEKIKRTRVQKLIIFLETQEFTILSLVCMVFFLAVLHSQKMYEPRYVIEFLVCIPVLIVIILTSTDYWNINYEEVNGSLRMWEELVRDVEAGKQDEIKNTREKEECHGEKTL